MNHPETMKAAVMYGPNDIRVEQVPYPKCPEDGVIMQVKACGLCGSDIRNLTTDSRKGDYPHIYGHEQTGIVCEVGPKHTRYKIGDRIASIDTAPCMKCKHCQDGRNDLCDDYLDTWNRQGGFAEYIPIPGELIERGGTFDIPEGVNFRKAALGEPMMSVYGCLETINVTMGDTVAILGAGPIGCFLTYLAKLRGAKTVIVCEISEKRLEMVKRFGADYTIDSSKCDPVAEVRRLTGGEGVDKAISANPTAAGQQQAIYMTAKGGTVVWFGGIPKGTLAEIDTNYVHYNSIWIYGHGGGSLKQIRAAFDLAMSDRIDETKVITHVLPLDKINEGIRLAKSGEAIKVMLIPGKE